MDLDRCLLLLVWLGFAHSQRRLPFVGGVLYGEGNGGSSSGVLWADLRIGKVVFITQNLYLSTPSSNDGGMICVTMTKGPRGYQMWLLVLMSFVFMGLGQFKIVGHNTHQQISSVAHFHKVYTSFNRPRNSSWQWGKSLVTMELRGLCISIQRFAQKTESQQEVVQYRAKQDGHFLRKHVTWLRVDSSKKLPSCRIKNWK